MQVPYAVFTLTAPRVRFIVYCADKSFNEGAVYSIADIPIMSIDKIKNLAEYRGSQCGLEMAEAFEIIRKIDR